MEVTVKNTNPVADGMRKSCMEAINNLSDGDVKKFKRILESPTAKSYVSNPGKWLLLKKFLKL